MEVEHYTAIGRILRACAEIDDIIHLYLCDLADVPEGMAILMLGRMSASQKLKIAEQFCLSIDKADLIERHRECFDNEHYYSLVKFRNTVAHGIMLGLTDDGEIAFQVHETAGVEASKVVMVVNAYVPESFEAMARMAEGVIPQLERRLSLTNLREFRKARGLQPHTKARSQRSKKTK